MTRRVPAWESALRGDEEEPVAAAGLGNGAFAVVDLGAHFNNDGISHLDPVPDGDLNGEGMAFPADVLPPSNQVVELCGVPFLFPDKESGAPNNVCLEGQVIEVPAGRYTRLHVLGVSEGGSFEEAVRFHYTDGAQETRLLRLTTCRPAWGRAKYGERSGIRCREMHFPSGETHVASDGDNCCMWVQALQVDGARELEGLELGDNESMHIFGLTLRHHAAGGIGEPG